jgi:hypothetical protein
MTRLRFFDTPASASAVEAVNILSDHGNILCRTGVKTIGKKNSDFLSSKIACIPFSRALAARSTKIDTTKDLDKLPETILKAFFMEN